MKLIMTVKLEKSREKGEEDMNNAWVKPMLRMKDVERLKQTVKVGDKFTYSPTLEKVVVVKVFRHLIQIESARKQKRKVPIIRTISFVELLFNNMGLTYRGKEQE